MFPLYKSLSLLHSTYVYSIAITLHYLKTILLYPFCPFSPYSSTLKVCFEAVTTYHVNTPDNIEYKAILSLTKYKTKILLCKSV